MTCKGSALLPKFMWLASGISKKRKCFWDQHVSMSNWFVLFCFLVIHIEFQMQLIMCPSITRVLANLWVQPETGRAWNGSILHSPASSLHKAWEKGVRLVLKTQSQHGRRPGQGCWQQKLPCVPWHEDGRTGSAWTGHRTRLQCSPNPFSSPIA